METRFSKISDKSADELAFFTKLDHPNLVRILSVDETADKKSLITMEDVAGSSLESFCEKYGGLDAKDTVIIGKKLCAAVGYLHSLTPPWLYCDMKPQNVMLTGSPGHIEDVVLVDIDGGCAMVMDGLLPEKSYGTRGYAAPEQLEPKGPLDFRVDVHGICATMDAVYKRPRLLRGRRERTLETIIKKGMSADPKERYFTVKELETALKEV